MSFWRTIVIPTVVVGGGTYLGFALQKRMIEANTARQLKLVNDALDKEEAEERAEREAALKAAATTTGNTASATKK